MGFLAPMAFIGLLSLPIIVLFYMMRKKTTPQIVSSILLWKRLDRLTSSTLNWNKIIKNMLLFLQLLIALLLVLSLARPMLLGMGKSSNNTVIIIDTSISMAVTKGGQSRLDEGIDQLRGIMERKNADTKVAILAAGEKAEIIIGLTQNKNQLISSLETISLSGGSPNIDEAFLMAESMAETLSDLDIILISDGNFQEINYPVDNFEFIYVGDGAVNNLYIENMFVEGQRVSVIVGNNGVSRLTSHLAIQDHLDNIVGTRIVELEPGERQTFIWRNLQEAPWFKAQLEQLDQREGEDQLPQDNSFYAVSSRDKSTKALLVTEGNAFLEKALILSDTLSISKVSKDNFQENLLDNYHIYIFDGFLPETLPGAPVLVFDPPYPNEHIQLTPPVKISNLNVGESNQGLTRHVDFSDVTIHFSKILQEGTGVLTSEQGNIVVEGDNKGYPMIVFGFPVQGGDFHLRPAFPIMLLNVLDYLMEYQLGIEGFDLYGYPTYHPPMGVEQLTLTDPHGNTNHLKGVFPLLGSRIEAMGVYTLNWMDNTLHIPVNHPRTTESLASQEDIMVQNDSVQGNKGKSNYNITWILLLLAVAAICAEWWIDNYVY